MITGRYNDEAEDELEFYLHEIRNRLAEGITIKDIEKMFPLEVDAGFAKKKARNTKLYGHLKQAGYEPSKVGNVFCYSPIEQLTAFELWDICTRRGAHVSGTLRNLIALIVNTPVKSSCLAYTQKEITQFKLRFLEHIKLALEQQIDYIDKASNWLKDTEEGGKEE